MWVRNLTNAGCCSQSNPSSTRFRHAAPDEEADQYLARLGVGRVTRVTAEGEVTTQSAVVLLHGASIPARTSAVAHPILHADLPCRHGWLHTGDLPLNEKGVWHNFSAELKKAPLKSPVCVTVAPHHGSGHDHEDALYDETKPGTVILTTGRRMSGPHRGSPSYSYRHGAVVNKARLIGASDVDLHN